jgi:asparagine synthase (glutamine-hydrolysing)
MVQHLSREGQTQPNGFETFSMVFPGKACDERQYIDAVVGKWNLRANYFEPGEREASGCLEQVTRYRDIPDYPNGLMSYPLKALAREKGFRVVLSGDGGDQWLDGRRYYCADLLRQLRVSALWKQIQFNSPGGSPRDRLRAFLKDGLTPWLPAWARTTLWGDGMPGYMGDDFAHRINLIERRKPAISKMRFRSLAQYEIFESLTSGMEVHAKEIGDRAYSWLKIEERHPLHDRRIIEFATALPGEQRRSHNQHRLILRQAMRGLLPEEVRNRPDKADFSHIFPEAFEALGAAAVFDSLAIASEGWVKPDDIRLKYREMLQLYRAADPRYMLYTWNLWMVFVIEAWFRTVFLNDRATSELDERSAPHCV